MLEGGLPLSELTKGIPDAPRETIQSVLEVLQVMGIVSLLKLRPGVVVAPDGSLTDPPISASGDSSGGPSISLYVMSSKCKTPEALDLRLLQQSTAIKKANAARAHERCAALLALTNRLDGMTRPERLVDLRAALASLNQKEPSLKDDMLYRTLGDLAAAMGRR